MIRGKKILIVIILTLVLTNINTEDIDEYSIGNNMNCGIYQMRGKRMNMEDRSICICPFINERNTPQICYMGIFDGHEGSHLSQMLANFLHVEIKSKIKLEKDDLIDLDKIINIVKESIDSIDEKFLILADKYNLDSGSTCIIGLLIDTKVLVFANIGNSKAIICKKTYNCLDLSKNTESLVLFNTTDHTPHLETERKRIEATGTIIENDKGIYRIDGGLELSRALGDLSYRNKGVISKPDIYVLNVTEDYGYVILGSDGVFNKLSSDLICVFAENSKYQCKHFQHWYHPDIENPIPLPGDTLIPMSPTINKKKNICEYPRLGLPFGNKEMEEYFVPHILKGLENCEDCFNDNNYCDAFHFHHTPLPSFSTLIETSESKTAASIIKEAYNRRSTDNLAISILNLYPKMNCHNPEEIISRNEYLKFGTIIKSDKSNSEYELVEKLRKIPKPKSQRVHVSIDSDNALQIYQYKNMETKALFLTNNSQSSISKFLSKNSHETCPINHHQLHSDHDHVELIQAIQSVPLLELDNYNNDENKTQYYIEKLHIGSDRLLDFFSQYKLEMKFATGSFGEIWRCLRKYDNGVIESGYILKRLMVERGEEVLLSGLRERYFGLQMEKHQKNNKLGYNHIVRYIESFTIGKELWLAFKDEGLSLHSIIYTHKNLSNEEGGIQLVSTSKEWLSMRESPNGDIIIKEILRQLLKAVARLHKDNIVHRDIKPDNILMNRLDGNIAFNLRLIDFGSAIDPISIERYYGNEGPTDAEQTSDYAPPEAIFHKLIFDSTDMSRYFSYDIWSIGIVWLELIFGTPNVFGLSDRTMALLSQKLNLFSLSESERNYAFLLRGMMELCIYPPRNRTDDYTHTHTYTYTHSHTTMDNDDAVMDWNCTEKKVLDVIKSKDPLKKGLPNTHAVRLLLRLLEWNPDDRISAIDALKSDFFMDNTS